MKADNETLRDKPPKAAERLLMLFLFDDDRSSVPGDLAEVFSNKILPTMGSTWARLWYWKPVIFSIRFLVRCRMRSQSPLKVVGNLGLSIVRFILSVLLVYALMACLYLAFVYFTGSDINRFYMTSGWRWLQPVGLVITSMMGIFLLERSQNWMRFLWANVILSSSGILAYTLLFSHASGGPNFWSRSICQIVPSLYGSIFAVEIGLGILALAFAVFVDRWCLFRLLNGSGVDFSARLRLFLSAFFLPVGIIFPIIRFSLFDHWNVYEVKEYFLRCLLIVLPGLLAILWPHGENQLIRIRRNE